MLFCITTEGDIVRKTDSLPMGGDRDCLTFASPQELQNIVGQWPMLRLLEIWNRLPGTRPVRRFEDRKTAIARIWRAIQIVAEQKPGTARQSSMRKAGKRVAFREESKAAQVCALLRRPEGATLGEIITATGWQPHTVRGFVSASLRKQGSRVRTFRRGSEHAYQLKL